MRLNDQNRAKLDALAAKADAWSPEAREAAAEARKGGGKFGGGTNKPTEHHTWQPPKTSGGVTTHVYPVPHRTTGKTIHHKVHDLGGGEVHAERYGYTTRHASVEAAKKHVETNG